MKVCNTTDVDEYFPYNNIGISISLPKKRVIGVLYQYPEDFVVIEEHDEQSDSSNKNESYIRATLIKCNISTLNACKQFALMNNLDLNEDLGICGFKDTNGITSQKISINKPNLKLKQTSFDNFFLKQIVPSNKQLGICSHSGNHFMIRVRDVVNIDEIPQIFKNFKSLINSGIPNFYGPQRFGRRQNNHILGRLLIKKDYNSFLYLFLTDSLNEEKEIIDIRQELKKNYGNWNECLRILDKTQYLSDEKNVIRHLLNKADLTTVMNEITFLDFYTHSYVSYLFNQALSNLLKNKKETTELIKLGKNIRITKRVREIYNEILEEDNVSFNEIKNCPFKLFGRNRLTKIYPQNFIFELAGTDIILSFRLGHGEYASWVLDNLVKGDNLKFD